MKSENDIQCRIVRIGGMPERQPVSLHREAQAAAKSYQEFQERPRDGTRYVMEVKNTKRKWRELKLNEDDDNETIVRLIGKNPLYSDR